MILCLPPIKGNKSMTYPVTSEVRDSPNFQLVKEDDESFINDKTYCNEYDEVLSTWASMIFVPMVK